MNKSRGQSRREREEIKKCKLKKNLLRFGIIMVEVFVLGILLYVAIQL